MEIQTGQTVLWPLGSISGRPRPGRFMLVSSYLLGERRMNRVKTQPYESGIVPTGSAWSTF